MAVGGSDVTAGRRRPALAAMAGVVFLALVFYTWTAKTSANLAPEPGLKDPYNLLTDAFLHGRLSLDLPVDPRLEGHSLPYGTELSTPETFDLSYYRGHLYAYWGPAPVILFAAFRVLGVGELPVATGALLAVFLALLLSLWLMHRLTERFVPGTPAWMRLLAGIGLAICGLGPFLLRRPAVYEMAQASAMVFMLAALCLVVAGAAPSHRRLVLASLCAGLAFLSRPPMGLVIVAVLGVAWRQGARRSLALLALPFVACVGVFLVYNQARFGAPLEFGQRYQINGIPNFRQGSLSFLPEGIWYYLISPPRLSVQFPFVWLQAFPNAPWKAPSIYHFSEPTGGILAATPVVALVLAAPWALHGRAPALRAIAALLLGIAVVLMLFASYTLVGVSHRYEYDFLVLLLVVAFLVWFVLAGSARPRPRAALHGGVVVLLTWSVIAAVAFSMVGLRDTLRNLHPSTYHRLASFFAPLPTFVTSLAGHPILAAVDGDATAGPHRLDRLGVEGADVVLQGQPITLQVVSPDSRSALLHGRIPNASAAPGAAIRVRSASGSATKPLTAGPVAIPVRLRRGLGELELTVVEVGGRRGRRLSRPVHFDDLRLG